MSSCARAIASSTIAMLVVVVMVVVMGCAGRAVAHEADLVCPSQRSVLEQLFARMAAPDPALRRPVADDLAQAFMCRGGGAGRLGPSCQLEPEPAPAHTQGEITVTPALHALGVSSSRLPTRATTRVPHVRAARLRLARGQWPAVDRPPRR
jgi:hypothetical protein